MNKKLIEKKIKELGAVLTSEKSIEALNILKKECSLLEIEDEVSTKNQNSDFLIPKELKQDTDLAVFTDGACRGNPGPGSFAYLVQGFTGNILSKNAIAEKYTTNNKMELKAAIEGLRQAKMIKTHTGTIHLYTDSKYVVDGITKWVQGWKKRGWKKADNKPPENLDIWQALDQEVDKCLVEFHWVKGHAGHPQNEYVDQLANIVLDENGF